VGTIPTQFNKWLKIIEPDNFFSKFGGTFLMRFCPILLVPSALQTAVVSFSTVKRGITRNPVRAYRPVARDSV
jgi:hypothetical protein